MECPGRGLVNRDVARGPDLTRKRPGGKALPAARLGNCHLDAGGNRWAQGKEQGSEKAS